MVKAHTCFFFSSPQTKELSWPVRHSSSLSALARFEGENEEKKQGSSQLFSPRNLALQMGHVHLAQKDRDSKEQKMVKPLRSVWTGEASLRAGPGHHV